MTFSWGDYLTLADQLKNHPDEEWQRTAISRAYYAAYHACLQRYQAKYGAVPPKPRMGMHECLWSAFKDKGQLTKDQVGKTHKQVEQDGRRLKQRRMKADYKLVYLPQGTLPTELADSVILARQLIATVNAIK